MKSLCVLPLIQRGETVGALALAFDHPEGFGATDRAFLLLLAQATASAVHRAWGYDTERKKRQEAEVLNLAREEVLGVVAHDLRNPLSVISGTTQILLESDLTREHREALLGSSTRAVKQMNRLMSDLLDTVRLQAGRLALDIELTSVGEILRQAEETFRSVANQRGIRLDIVLPDIDTPLRADPLRVAQIVGNLVGNAIKFTPPHGYVALDAVIEGNEVMFQVTDSGPGIAPSHLAHLFDRFWQARRSDHRGAGLGLTIARGLVEAHGGKIWVDSMVGVGTTFSFTLPGVGATPARRVADAQA